MLKILKINFTSLNKTTMISKILLLNTAKKGFNVHFISFKKLKFSCCVQVSVIDEGLLKFSKLEELVLSANKIREIPAENLPSTLKASLLTHGDSSRPFPFCVTITSAIM